jgi:hypothetical protein
MAEVLVEFDTVIPGADGTKWAPRVCGRVAPDSLWEGWIEFTPLDDAVDPVRTMRETEQPNRGELMYWAQGLTQAYLEGALARALAHADARARKPAPRAKPSPRFERPAPRIPPPADVALPRPVLNPFDVYQQGEDVLVRELSALDVRRVRDIAVAFGFLSPAAASGKTRDELTPAIIAGVRQPFAGR